MGQGAYPNEARADSGEIKGKRSSPCVLDGMDSEIASGALQRLLGVNKVALNELAKRGIVTRGRSSTSFA
jgi:hypothetical protein